MPDPNCQFVVKVAVGRALSQRSANNQNLPPCAFFSYWAQLHHWQMGAEHGKIGVGGVAAWAGRVKQPFLVWTDHRNLAYVGSTKQLNSRPAQWALVLIRFNLVFSPRFQKCQARCSLPTVPEGGGSRKPFFLPRALLQPSHGRFRRVWVASECQPGPSTCPDDPLFLANLCAKVLEGGHSSWSFSLEPRGLRTRSPWLLSIVLARWYTLFLCQGDCPACDPARLLAPLAATGRGFRSGSSVHVGLLDGVLPDCLLCFRIILQRYLPCLTSSCRPVLSLTRALSSLAPEFQSALVLDHSPLSVPWLPDLPSALDLFCYQPSDNKPLKRWLCCKQVLSSHVTWTRRSTLTCP